MQAMVRAIMERVRLSAEESRLLRRLARKRKASKSEVLREGLHAIEREDERQRQLRIRDRERHAAFDQLIKWAREVPGDDIKWEGRP